MTITTDRLILRELIEDDIENMWKLSQDPEVTKYMDYIKFKTYDDAKKWVVEKIHHNNSIPRYSYSFAIVLKDTQEFIGWIGIGDAEDKTIGDLDFGYAISKKHWRKGYTTEALKEIIAIGFKELNANKIFGQCNINNKASQLVMLKAGMEFERTFEEDGVDSVRYSITSEYQK